jgi:hypothetical protein
MTASEAAAEEQGVMLDSMTTPDIKGQTTSANHAND